MTSVSNNYSAALIILQQQPINPADQVQSDSQDLLAIANRQPVKQTVAATAQPTKSESKISETLFSVNNPSITQMKLDLIDRTGQELGIDKND